MLLLNIFYWQLTAESVAEGFGFCPGLSSCVRKRFIHRNRQGHGVGGDTKQGLCCFHPFKVYLLI